MTLVLMFSGLALFALAALRWGADSTDTVNSPEWQRRQLWPGVSGATFGARLGAVLASPSYPTEGSVLSGVDIAGPMNLLLLEAAAPAPALDLCTPVTQENATLAPAADRSTWVVRENSNLELTWVWPAN